MIPPRHQIRRAFDKAASAYDQAASVQRHACERLLATISGITHPGTILDAGCGTGHGLRLLTQRFPAARAFGVDLAPAMAMRTGTAAVADVERLPLGDHSVDLYWSSLTAQWCDPARLLGEARRVLRPGGRLALATLGTETFREIRTAFAGDGHAHTIAFETPAALAAMAAAAGFRAISLAEERQVAHHPDLRALLASVKAIGANQVGQGRRPGLMGRETWRRIEAAYEALREPMGLPLTYHLIYLGAEA